MKPKLSLANAQIIGRAMLPDAVAARTTKRMPKTITLAPHLSEQMTYRTDRALAWIKLPVALLDDERFNRLDDATRAHVVMLMLYIGRTGRSNLPADGVQLARFINASTCIDVVSLLQSKCFVAAKRLRCTISTASQTRQDKTREEEKTDKTARGSSSSSFSFDERLRFAHAQASIREPVKFAGATKDGRADAEISEWLKRTAPPRRAVAECPHCYGSGFDTTSGNARRCECLT
jgi:hypothetical protein